MAHDEYFYGSPVFRDAEEEYIEKVLDKYKDEPVTDELLERVYNELSTLKSEGKIRIPFRVVMRADNSGQYPDYIEVILDSKV